MQSGLLPNASLKAGGLITSGQPDGSLFDAEYTGGNSSENRNCNACE
jgi:hypothetical protein